MARPPLSAAARPSAAPPIRRISCSTPRSSPAGSGYPELGGLDLLELFAFSTRRALPCRRRAGWRRRWASTRRPATATPASCCAPRAALLDTVDDPAWPARHGAWTILQALSRQRWSWAPLLARRLRKPEAPERSVFTTLPKWEEAAPRPAPHSIALPDAVIDARLDTMLGAGAERRDGQRAYALAVGAAFQPRRMPQSPNMVLAEAGTGIGKTLGYLAPASGWAAGGARHCLAVDLHQGAATPARSGSGARLSRSGRKARQGGGAQGPRELPLPAQP